MSKIIAPSACPKAIARLFEALRNKLPSNNFLLVMDHLFESLAKTPIDITFLGLRNSSRFQADNWLHFGTYYAQEDMFLQKHPTQASIVLLLRFTKNNVTKLCAITYTKEPQEVNGIWQACSSEMIRKAHCTDYHSKQELPPEDGCIYTVVDEILPSLTTVGIWKV